MKIQQNPGRRALAPCAYLDQTLPPRGHLLLVPARLSLIWAPWSKCQSTESCLLCAVIHERAELRVGRVPGELWEQPALSHTSHGRRRPPVIPSTPPPANFCSNAKHRAHLHCKISCLEGRAVILHITPVTKLEGKVTGSNMSPSHSLAAPKEMCCTEGINTTVTT